MNRKIINFLLTFIIILLLNNIIIAQTLGGSVTRTEIIKNMPEPNSDLVSSIEYSNWKWTDSKGVIRSFNGTTRDRYVYTYYTDGRIIFRGISSTSLVDVQATDGSKYYLNAKGGTGYINGYGVLYPKYQVISVIYAAPGTGSKIDYTNTSVAGSSTNTSSSFANGMQFSATVGTGFFGLVEGTTTYSLGWTTTATKSNTISISKTQGSSLASDGQTNPPYGINHDYDQIVICLNPILLLGDSTSSSITSVPKWSLACDLRDPNAGSGPDIVYLTVAQLKNPSLITDQSLLNRLARSWAGPGQGLTIADYQNILSRNPFANDGITGSRPFFDSSKNNNRFYQVSSIYYAPLQPGQGPQTSSGYINYTALNTYTVGTQDVYSVSSVTAGDVNFFAVIGINSTSNYTWTNTASATTSSGGTQLSSYSIPRPPSNWTGPSEILIWQDMVYGTFFFSY